MILQQLLDLLIDRKAYGHPMSLPIQAVYEDEAEGVIHVLRFEFPSKHYGAPTVILERPSEGG